MMVISSIAIIALIGLLYRFDRKKSKGISEIGDVLKRTQEDKGKLVLKINAHKRKMKQMSTENNQLQEQVKEAETIQKEMKAFVDMQIETNEQLLIAETKLKNLLDKEKESKAIMNQTLDKCKDTQGQLVHSEKMASLGQLTAGIAHEINNPINFVYNGIGSLQTSLGELAEILDKYALIEAEKPNTELLQEIKALKEEVEYDDLRSDLDELLIDIKEGAVRTIEIVKGLRVFSRLDEEDRKEANINECLEATLVLLKNKTKNRINVVKDLASELPPISCFPGQLNQVFMNIINNAIQAIPDDKKDAEISVVTEQNSDGIVIRLRDNGTGMTDEVKNRIFEPFFTTKPVGVGTGLGMSISYGIIEKHQGKLEVSSELGKGTEFSISLPMNVAHEYSQAM